MDHLEQLAAEWYEHRGYFLRRNIRVGRRDLGGVAEHRTHVVRVLAER